MRRVVVDCKPIADELGRTVPPSGEYRDLSPAEETAYSSQQSAETAVLSSANLTAQQRSTDLDAVCAAGRLPGGGTFAALCRLLGGTV